jgi:magnesium-protoporphyrin O-methyltransferase
MMATQPSYPSIHKPAWLSLSKPLPSLPLRPKEERKALRQAQGSRDWEIQRDALETYFDSTAQRAWIDLTSTAKVGRIRATVRAGRDRMRATLLGWLPADLRRTRLLDAGCGTGAFAIEAARRGAEVVAIDVAAGLVDVARERAGFLGHGTIDWRVGDMRDPALGRFDHAVAMDSLIHYAASDIADLIATLSQGTEHSILFTFAPSTRALETMHRVGRLFPRGNRAPAIQPVREDELRDRLAALPGWRIGRTERVSSGFYASQAMELVRR